MFHINSFGKGKLGGYEIIDGKLTLALNMIFVVQFIPSVPFHYMHF